MVACIVVRCFQSPSCSVAQGVSAIRVSEKRYPGNVYCGLLPRVVVTNFVRCDRFAAEGMLTTMLCGSGGGACWITWTFGEDFGFEVFGFEVFGFEVFGFEV